MKKIIPFKKEILFKNNISEIISISLEHDFKIDNQTVNGEFTVSGDYKVSDNSITLESFSYSLNFENTFDKFYDISSVLVDVDDFYYEIINDHILSISIDVSVERIKEKLVCDEIPSIDKNVDIIDELYEQQNNEKEFIADENNLDKVVIEDSRCIDEDDIVPGGDESFNMNNNNDDEVKNEIVNDKLNSLFGNMGDSNVYIAYNVYIFREGDTIESILNKYSTSEDELKKYNNLSDLKLGDKIIIPAK